MTAQASWVFIGGRRHGLELLRRLFAAGEAPRRAYVLREDEHEPEKHAEELAELCRAHGVPCRITRKVGSEQAAEIRGSDPGLIAVMGWRSVIPGEILAIPRFGAVALHDSLLPRYRGFAPINWAIINGETETGVSLFYLDEGIDSGPIVAQRRIAIGPDDTGAHVYARVADEAVALMAEYVPRLARGRVGATPQDESAASYTCARTPDDGFIDWSAPTRRVYDLVRALAYPYPGAFTYLDGTRLTVWKARPREDPPRYVGRIPGRVVGLGAHGVEVLTGDGILRVEEVQLAGGEVRPAREVVSSVRLTLGGRRV